MIRWGQLTRCMAAVVLACPLVSAQILRLNAGSSDQYRSQGGSLELSTGHMTSGLGIGMVDGELRTGGYLRESIRNYDLTIGDQAALLDLPTDQFGGAQQFDIRGLSVARNSKTDEAFVFAGYKSLSFGAPYFRAATRDEAVGLVLYSHKFSDRFKFVSRNLFSSENTSIQGLEWLAKDYLKLGVSGGVGSGNPYAAISANLDLRKVSAKFAYIEQGENFRRATFDNLVVAEPKGANASLRWKATRHLTTEFAHTELNGTTLSDRTLPSAKVDSAGVNWNSKPLQAGANFYTSTAAGQRTNAYSLTGGRKITSWLDVNANWLSSKAALDAKWTSSLIGTFRERVSGHLELAQFVTRSNGNTTASFGGNWIGNRLSFGLEYQTIYVPYVPSKPFTQAAVLNIRFRPFGNLQLHGGTALGADGRARYTAWADDMFIRNGGPSAPMDGASISMPKYVVRGQVTDDRSQPVRGVALRIGKELVYTDEDGMFFVRMGKRAEFPLTVVFDEFMAPGYWSVVAAPDKVDSDLDEKAPNLEIVLKRISKDESRRRRMPPENEKTTSGSPVAKAAYPN